METLETETKVLVERLTARMDLHRIFLFSHPCLEGERQHLLLIVNPVKGLAPKTMAPIVSLSMSDGKAIPFDLVLTGEWQNQLKQGSLYYTYASLPQHELYAASKKGNPLFLHKTVGGLLELAEVNYEKCCRGSDEFCDGAKNFIARGDYGQATFMLHQFLELRLKGFLATAGMNGGKSHNVEHLMKGLRGVLPQLQDIFPYDGPSVDLFRLLDQSYVKAKRQESIEITIDEFNVLAAKCELAKNTMDGLVALMVERIKAYKDQLAKEPEPAPRKPTGSTSKASETPSSQVVCQDFTDFPWPEQYKRDANALLDNLYKTHRPEQIVMLNYHTGGFSGGNLFQERGEDQQTDGSKVELYLAVLMKNKGPFHFKCVKAGLASGMVIYLNMDAVEKRLSEGNRFMHRLWTKGTVLRKKVNFSPDFVVAEVDWNAVHERVAEVWTNAKTCMQHVNQVIQHAEPLTLDAGLLLLRNMLEIGTRTYLRCLVGYVPKGISLAELVDWSGIAGLKLLDFVYPISNMSKVQLQLVLFPEMVWWKNVEIGLSSVSQSFCKDKAKEMLHFFEGLCEEVVNGVRRKTETKAEQEVA